MDLLTSTRLGESDSDEEEVDFNKSVKAETGLGIKTNVVNSLQNIYKPS